MPITFYSVQRGPCKSLQDGLAMHFAVRCGLRLHTSSMTCPTLDKINKDIFGQVSELLNFLRVPSINSRWQGAILSANCSRDLC